ncbi:UDP-N-acetylmuramate dehydrogenase [Bacteroidota bacterium]
MEIKENISLKSFNTFGIEAKADYFVSVKNVNDIFKLMDTDVFQKNRLFILGGGSNVLFADDFHGLVINIDIKGIHIKESTDDYLMLNVGAGEDWSKFVETCVKSEYYGIENLAMIPGKVGAAPVQNIGAYGVEQEDLFVTLSGVDLQRKEIVHLNYEDCKFAYRSSIFKDNLKDRFIITSVQYRLSRKKQFNFSYSELELEINKFPVKDVDLKYVFDTVCRLRKSKLPDVGQIGSAGSFFKNPVVSSEKYFELKKNNPDLPGYPFGNEFKLSAGWLIEQCGWKGKRAGDAGVYDKHALILVNYGNATGLEILELAEKIKGSVNEKFGVGLEPEVQIITNY